MSGECPVQGVGERRDGYDRDDVLVVGSGGGAMTAVTAAELGAKVIVVEKAPVFGGTSATSGGAIWVPNNHHQRGIEGFSDSASGYAYVRQLVGSDVPRPSCTLHGRNAPRMLADMEAKTDVNVVQ
ncbi:FAD-dependent oxidoreductase [Sphingomonas sp. MMS24-JH45]